MVINLAEFTQKQPCECCQTQRCMQHAHIIIRLRFIGNKSTTTAVASTEYMLLPWISPAQVLPCAQLLLNCATLLQMLMNVCLGQRYATGHPLPAPIPWAATLAAATTPPGS